MSSRIRFLSILGALAIVTSAAACSSDASGPSESGTGGAGASAVVTVDSALGAGGVSRIEIELFPGELVAREVEVESDDEEEKIESSVTAIDPGQGTITLALGGLTVSYGSSTRFRTEEESHESREVWEALIQQAIAAGREPQVEARRSASGPQAPDDASFIATDLRLDDERDEPKLELYVDGDNLVSTDDASLVLRVLGLSITVNGRTHLGPDDNGGGTGQPASVEFEMSVSSVDPNAGTLTLSSGTVVRVTEATAISAEGDLTTLQAASDAVAQGRPVRAEGRGTVESSGPPAVIVASTIKIEVDD
jgi:hypothetical protein